MSKAKTKTTKKKTGGARAKKSTVTASNTRDAQSMNKLIVRKGISLWDPAAIVATVFSVGRIPFAPGTWGSLVGVALFPLFLLPPIYVNHKMPSPLIVCAVCVSFLVLLYCIGVMAIKNYQAKTKTSDAQEIVYDEFFGQILTYSLSYAALFWLNKGPVIAGPQHVLVYEFVPFLFFRLFDICKPWPINIIDRNEDSAWGVMFDDVVGSFYAAAACVVVFMVANNYI